MIARSCATALLTAFLLFGSQPAGVQPNPNAVVAGEFIVEPPTLISLGFEWKIQGDDNRNADRRSAVPQVWRIAVTTSPGRIQCASGRIESGRSDPRSKF